MRGITSLRSREILSETTSVKHALVLVIGDDGRVLHFTEWKRAIQLVSNDEAYVIETVKRRLSDGSLAEVMLRSPSSAVPLPLIIGLRPHVYVPSIAFILARTEHAGRIAVLRRDKYTCGYCGNKGARTIDHIFPKSRGGRNTWQNLVAACRKCNNDKADRTPEESGMPLLFDPRVEEGGAEDIQAEVWRYLETASSAGV